MQVHLFTTLVLVVKLRKLFESWFGTVGFFALVASPPQSKGPFKAFGALADSQGVLVLHPPRPPAPLSEKKSSSRGIGVRVVVDAVPLFLYVCL